MSVAEVFNLSDEPAVCSTAELADVLVGVAGRLAAMECRWLAYLAEFDRREGWFLDGQFSCIDWLVWKCGLSRASAFEKRRVAHELRRRPAVNAAFASGRLSYSKVRAITRVAGADEETDRWLLKLAELGTATDLDRAARHYEQLQDQERGVEDYLKRYDRRGTRVSRTYDGMMVIEQVSPIEEGEEYLALVNAAVDESPAGDLSPAQLRADAAMALARAGRAALDKPASVDRYTVHVVVNVETFPDGAELLDGTPISPRTLERWACDCGIIRHVVRGKGEPLDIGRRTSVWTTAQRRAITVRDKGTCRWPGCNRRTCDVHHLAHYQNGGPTSVENGLLLCPRHHTCVHEGGFTIRGKPNADLAVYRPDGNSIGTSTAKSWSA